MKRTGILLAQDSDKNAIILEWEEIAGNTSRLSEKIKSLTEILVPSYLKTEIDFAQKKPDLVCNDFMLKSLAPLLEKNDVDWKLFERKAKELLEQFFLTTDWTKHSNAQDTNIFVLARDKKTGNQVGVIQFLSTAELGQHTIKAALQGIVSSSEAKGLEKLLMSSIFKLRPEVKRVFLHTRSTNEEAIDKYQDWGFKSYRGELVHWTDLEYLAETSHTLQVLSEGLISQD